MKSKMESIKINNVWTLIDPSEGVKPIGCKWIFKRKRGVNEKVETYKAYLVVKGYCQYHGIDMTRYFFS